MSFDTDEESREGNRPIELYEFTIGPTTYRRTSFGSDYTWFQHGLGLVYTAAPIRRGAAAVFDASTGDVPSMQVDLPVTDAVVQAYLAGGVPPQRATVTISRIQQVSGESKQIWTGNINSCSVRGRTATFRVAPATGDSFSINVPGVRFQKQCNHVLYDSGCTVDRASNSTTTTIVTIGADRRTVTVASLGAFPVGDYQFGDFVHATSDERRTIVATSGTTLTLDVRLPTTVAVGDSITISRGCNHDVSTCWMKFNNVSNFGGHPQIKGGTFFFQNIKVND